MQIIADEWLRRVEAEYRSVAIAHHYTLWLIQVGASPDLIRDGLRIVDDEITHAELSYKVHVESGGTEMPNMAQETLGLSRESENIYEDLIRVGTSFFCLGETAAVPLFQRMRKDCTVPCAREALDQILVDEVRHRDFGWTLLDWLLETSPDLKPVLEKNLDSIFQNIVESYTSAASEESITDEQRSWGLISGSEYADVLKRCFARDYQPRFAQHDIQIPEFPA